MVSLILTVKWTPEERLKVNTVFADQRTELFMLCCGM